MICLDLHIMLLPLYLAPIPMLLISIASLRVHSDYTLLRTLHGMVSTVLLIVRARVLVYAQLFPWAGLSLIWFPALLPSAAASLAARAPLDDGGCVGSGTD